MFYAAHIGTVKKEERRRLRISCFVSYREPLE
jgi:hypothetical protein